MSLSLKPKGWNSRNTSSTTMDENSPFFHALFSGIYFDYALLKNPLFKDNQKYDFH
jgi:hypothetical protein